MQLRAPLLLFASFQASPEFISKMRDAAVSYADRLQDFICIQSTIRSVDGSGSGKHWKRLETRELELGYISHKEHYRLLKVNGKTNDLQRRIKKGYFRPGGEFGRSLETIFDPKTAAEFEWDHEESAAGKRICVFRYHVPLRTSKLSLTADEDVVKMAHHGFVSADCDSGMVTRIQMESEPASLERNGQTRAIGVQLDVRYGLTTIGSREFMLPQQASEIAHFGRTLTKVELQFQHYRKYEADSNITFDNK